METVPYDKDANIQFDSKTYLQRYTNPIEPLGYQVQFLECWHQFYRDHHQDFDASNSTMLEFGGGPAVWSLISAAPNMSSITFSDFGETNRAEIEIWRDNKSGCHDWKPYVEYVVRTLESNQDPNAVDLRVQEIRRKLQNVVFCDARSEKSLGEMEQQFDVIQTSFCLEAVCEDKDAFYAAFANFRQYLKPKGYLLCITALEGSWYQCWKGVDKLHQLNLKSEDLETALTRSGFTVIYTRIAHPASTNVVSASKKWQFVVARKND